DDISSLDSPDSVEDPSSEEEKPVEEEEEKLDELDRELLGKDESVSAESSDAASSVHETEPEDSPSECDEPPAPVLEVTPALRVICESSPSNISSESGLNSPLLSKEIPM